MQTNAERNATKSRARARNRKVVQDYKYSKGCERCGYNACVAALDLHHRNPRLKTFELSDGKDRSVSVILAELAKCDVLCANCHREEHARV